jgi:hypothetical protein
VMGWVEASDYEYAAPDPLAEAAPGILLRAGFTVREAIAADHNRDQRCDLGNRAGEQVLDGCKSAVEGRAPGLSMGCEWKDEQSEDPDAAQTQRQSCLEHRMTGANVPESDLHWHLQQPKNRS